MIARLSALWDHVRASLWPAPLAIACACGAAAIFALSWTGPIPDWLYQGATEDAAAFTAALVTAMITVTTLSLSITMVVLTLAAQQLGPRLILIFLRAWFTQCAIGLFVGASVYLVLVLRALGGEGEVSANLAVSIGTGLVLVSLVVLVLFVHSVGRSIVADHVIAVAGRAFDAGLLEAFPERSEPLEAAPKHQTWPSIRLQASGYVQRIDRNALIDGARCRRVQVVLLVRPGALHRRACAPATQSGAAAGYFRRRRRALRGDRAPARDPGERPISWAVRRGVKPAVQRRARQRLRPTAAAQGGAMAGDFIFGGWDNIARILAVAPLAYVALVLFLRISGKRTLSKLNAFDLVVTVALGSTLATQILSADTPLIDGLTAFAALIALQWVVTSLSMRSPLVRRIVRSEPAVLFWEGRLCRETMRQERVTESEVLQAVRASGGRTLDDAVVVFLQTDGGLSAIAKPNSPHRA